MTWLYTHRLLLVVYASGLTLAMFELGLPENRAGDRYSLYSPELFLDPDVNVADVSAELYPDRALTLYYRAFQASLCSGSAAETPPACRQRELIKKGEVRALIERSLATGNRSIEMAMYNYVRVLIQEKAPQQAIDEAIRNWRTSFPNSRQTDPRGLSREMTRQR